MSAVNTFSNYSQHGLAPACPSCGESVNQGATSCAFCFATFPAQRAQQPQPGQPQAATPTSTATAVSCWRVLKTLLCGLAILLAVVLWLIMMGAIGVAGFSYVTKTNPHFADKLKLRTSIWQCRRAERNPSPRFSREDIQKFCDDLEADYRQRHGSAP